MQFRTTGLLLLGAMALTTSGAAQTTPAPAAISRTVAAEIKGLHDNDFIMASKSGRLLDRRDGSPDHKP